MPAKVMTFKSLKAINNKLVKDSEADIRFKGEKVVTGVGPSTSSLMVVGEAPGRHEVEFGVPFIGRAGSFFTKILKEKLGLDREDYYISNIVKIWPHEKTNRGRTRPPRKDETEFFLPFIKEEIKVIEPKIILAVGKVAFNNLTGIDDFKPGTMVDYDGNENIKVMPLYHPAYMLRKQKMMDEFMNDLSKHLLKVKKILK